MKYKETNKKLKEDKYFGVDVAKEEDFLLELYLEEIRLNRELGEYDDRRI